MNLKVRGCESGQTIVEYILLLSAVVSLFLFLSKGISDSEFGQRLMAPISQDYRTVYQYGKKGVVGYENNGTPEDHPRAEVPVSSNFRIFINPGTQ